MLELHTYGPAFSLPSLDAQCLATIAYFTQAVPRDQWTLIASSDPSLSPTGELPALRNGHVWIGGFRNIVHYVKQYSRGEWDLDKEAGLEEGSREWADCVAFSTFLETHATPLLAASLYLSSENYNSVTRPQFNSLLPFPLSWTIPSKLRAVARKRCAHLGLESLDLDAADTEESKDKDAAAATAGFIPASLQFPSSTQPKLSASATAIRLHNLTSHLLSPLQQLRGPHRRYILPTPSPGRPTTLDCLALSYLSLFLLPDLPHPFLARAMRADYPQLCAYVHEFTRSWFGAPATLGDAGLGSGSPPRGPGGGEEADGEEERAMGAMGKGKGKGKGKLPWGVPMARNVPAMLLSETANHILDSIPLLSSFRSTARLRHDLESSVSDEDPSQKAEIQTLMTARNREILATAATVAGGVAAFVAFCAYYGILGRFVLGQGESESVREGDASSSSEGWETVPRTSSSRTSRTSRTSRARRGAGEEKKPSALVSQYGDAGGVLDVLFGGGGGGGGGFEVPVGEEESSGMARYPTDNGEVDVEVELPDRTH